MEREGVIICTCFNVFCYTEKKVSINFCPYIQLLITMLFVEVRQCICRGRRNEYMLSRHDIQTQSRYHCSKHTHCIKCHSTTVL